MKDKYISKLKFMAIISVICAHSNTVSTSIKEINFMSYLLNALGIIGVPVFYIISGYFFEKKKYNNLKNIARDKIKIVVPWLIIGTLVYLYVMLRRGDITIINWIKFLLGCNNYLYYLTNLMFYFILFCKGKKYIFIVGIILFVMSFYNNSSKIIEIPLYLNPFNFIIYFMIGILIQRYKKMKNIQKHTKTYKNIYALIWILIFILYYKMEILINYFNFESLILNLFGIVFVFGICSSFNYGYSIGEKSFALYLYHMPIAGMISYFFNKMEILNYILIIRPILVLISTIFLINMIEKIFKILKKEKELIKIGL